MARFAACAADTLGSLAEPNFCAVPQSRQLAVEYAAFFQQDLDCLSLKLIEFRYLCEHILYLGHSPKPTLFNLDGQLIRLATASNE